MKLLFSKNDYGTYLSYTKINVILSKCDNVIENIQIHMPWRVFLLVWKFSQMWKIYIWREISSPFFFEKKKKKTLDLKKLKIMLQYFPIGFGLVSIF